MPDKFGWDNNFGNKPAPTRHARWKAAREAVHNVDRCSGCLGTGQIADYIGLEMKCVGVECPDCKGTGKTPAIAERSQP